MTFWTQTFQLLQFLNQQLCPIAPRVLLIFFLQTYSYQLPSCSLQTLLLHHLSCGLLQGPLNVFLTSSITPLQVLLYFPMEVKSKMYQVPFPLDLFRDCLPPIRQNLKPLATMQGSPVPPLSLCYLPPRPHKPPRSTLLKFLYPWEFSTMSQTCLPCIC